MSSALTGGLPTAGPAGKSSHIIVLPLNIFVSAVFYLYVFFFFFCDFYQDILILSELTFDDFLKNGIYNSSGMMYWVFIFNDHLKSQNTAPAD